MVLSISFTIPIFQDQPHLRSILPFHTLQSQPQLSLLLLLFLNSILWRSAFFLVQPSHLYMTTEKTIALTRQTFVDKVMRFNPWSGN